MVRRKHFIGMMLMGLLAVAACTSIKAPEPVEGPSPELCAIDSLMWRQPDSALAVLLEYDGNTDGFNGHYAQLLASELLYKNDYEQTNRPELQRAVGYFDSLLVMADTRHASTKTTAFLDARAHYINGVGYYERDSVVEACEEYLKALEIMESHFEEKELIGYKAKFMALTCTHLTALYSDQYLHEQAIYFGQLSLPYYQKHDATPWHLAWIFCEIGSQYDMMERLDSAASYYRQAYEALPDTIGLTYRDILAHQVYLKYKKDRQSTDVLTQLYRLLSEAESDKEYLARALSIAEIYCQEKSFDSAMVYLNEVFQKAEGIDSKILAAQRLKEMYEDDTVTGNVFSLFLSQYVSVGDENGKMHSELANLSQKYEKQRQDTFHQKEKNSLRKLVGYVLCILFVLTAFLLVVLSMNHRKHKMLKLQNEEAAKQLESERYEHKIKQAALSGRLKRSNESLRTITQQLEDVRIIQKIGMDGKKTKTDFTSFIESEICRHILEIVEDRNFKAKIDCLVYKDYALNKKQLKELAEAADLNLARFGLRLKKDFPDLTDDDIYYCYLYLLGLKDADISALMQRAYSTVCERNRKIKRIIGTEGNLSLALRNLV